MIEQCRGRARGASRGQVAGCVRGCVFCGSGRARSYTLDRATDKQGDLADPPTTLRVSWAAGRQGKEGAVKARRALRPTRARSQSRRRAAAAAVHTLSHRIHSQPPNWLQRVYVRGARHTANDGIAPAHHTALHDGAPGAQVRGGVALRALLGVQSCRARAQARAAHGVVGVRAIVWAAAAIVARAAQRRPRLALLALPQSPYPRRTLVTLLPRLCRSAAARGASPAQATTTTTPTTRAAAAAFERALHQSRAYVIHGDLCATVRSVCHG